MTIDDYLAAQPPATAALLQRIRGILRNEIPDGEEAISYQIPTIRLPKGKKKNNVLHYAGFKDHVSLFPRTNAVEAALGDALAPYATGKGTLAFPLNQPLPEDLIRQVARVRLRETLEIL